MASELVVKVELKFKEFCRSRWLRYRMRQAVRIECSSKHLHARSPGCIGFLLLRNLGKYNFEAVVFALGYGGPTPPYDAQGTRNTGTLILLTCAGGVSLQHPIRSK